MGGSTRGKGKGGGGEIIKATEKEGRGGREGNVKEEEGSVFSITGPPSSRGIGPPKGLIRHCSQAFSLPGMKVLHVRYMTSGLFLSCRNWCGADGVTGVPVRGLY